MIHKIDNKVVWRQITHGVSSDTNNSNPITLTYGTSQYHPLVVPSTVCGKEGMRTTREETVTCEECKE